MRFRIGDRVVIIIDEDARMVGVTGTVLEDSSCPYIKLDDESKYPREFYEDEEKQWAVNESNLELDLTYNSPLRQTLR